MTFLLDTNKVPGYDDTLHVSLTYNFLAFGTGLPGPILMRNRLRKRLESTRIDQRPGDGASALKLVRWFF